MANICVFTSASEPKNKIYEKAIVETGELIGKSGHVLVYGGANFGLMGKLARATQQNGGKVIGVRPKIFAKYAQIEDELIITEDMRDRKAKMTEISDGFIATAGGFGTLEEIADVLVSRQLKIHRKPIAIINTNDFYKYIIKHFEMMFKENFAPKENSLLYGVVDNPEEALEYILNYEPTQIAEDKKI